MSGAFAPGTFTWALGIEDTCVYPPARFAMAPLDEHVLTGHDRAWRADLDTVRDLGATALRYGVDWPLAHPAPDVFDWTALDERLAHAAANGTTVIADLVHYGTPTWLTDSFADPGYPAAVAAFAGAFAERYAGVVDHVTPLNEPITTASFAGLRGVWPPALHGWTGWTRVVLGIAAGIQQTVAAVRAANPAATIVHVEATSDFAVGDESTDAAAEVRLLQSLGTVPTDLVLGRVTRSHPMRDWLITNGASAATLDALEDGAVTLDLLGVNYYPDLSPRRVSVAGGRTVQHAHDRWTTGLTESLRRFHDRYDLPLVVTETSVEGSDDHRSAWVVDAARAVVELADDGLDVRGFTWWPLFDFVDWSYAAGGRNVEEFEVAEELVSARTHDARKTPSLRRMGLVRLEEQADGELVRVPTAAAWAFRGLTSAPAPTATQTPTRTDPVR